MLTSIEKVKLFFLFQQAGTNDMNILRRLAGEQQIGKNEVLCVCFAQNPGQRVVPV